MGTNRTRRTRTREGITLDPTIIEFLETGEKPKRGTLAWDLYVSRHFDGGAAIEAARKQYRGHYDKE